METVTIPNLSPPTEIQPPPLPPRTAKTATTTEWRRSDPLMRVPEGFVSRVTHAHNDAVAMGWYAPIVFLAVTVSSTLYMMYRGTIWCVDQIRSRL